MPGSPVLDGCTLGSSRMVKVVAICPAAGHGSLRSAGPRGGQAERPSVAQAGEWGSRAVAGGAVLLPVRSLARARAGGQDGLACPPGPASSSAHCVRHVKSVTGGWPAAQHAAVCPMAAGGTAAAGDGEGAVRPGRRARARFAPSRG